MVATDVASRGIGMLAFPPSFFLFPSPKPMSHFTSLVGSRGLFWSRLLFWLSCAIAFVMTLAGFLGALSICRRSPLSVFVTQSGLALRPAYISSSHLSHPMIGEV